MTIKFEKETELSGDTYYRIYVDGTCIKSFLSEGGDNPTVATVAKNFYTQVIERAKSGKPIKETLAEETITPKP